MGCHSMESTKLPHRVVDIGHVGGMVGYSVAVANAPR
jgi:hypothetical protein